MFTRHNMEARARELFTALLDECKQRSAAQAIVWRSVHSIGTKHDAICRTSSTQTGSHCTAKVRPSWCRHAALRPRPQLSMLL